MYLLGLLAAFCIGLSKAGFSGVSLVSVALLAELYGPRESVGLALPLLIVADLLAYPAFAAHGSWRPVWRLLGPALVGLALGWWMLGWIPDDLARRLIGSCVLLMVIVQLVRRIDARIFDPALESKWFGAGVGIAGGLATMLANAAGPVIQLYLAARKIPKMELIGIGARFFLLINLIKVPLNARLALITHESLIENLKLLPAVVLGVFGGRYLVRRVPQSAFEWIITGFALIAGLRLLIGW